MRVLATFPGRHGDILWALPAIRALSGRIGAPIDLMVGGAFRSICPLIAAQDYIGRCWADPFWVTQDTAPISPRVPPGAQNPPSDPPVWDLVLHLGYRGWPARPLPFETLDCLNEQLAPLALQGFGHTTPRIADEELALQEPWITLDGPGPPVEFVAGFSDEHFELKVGLVTLLSDMSQPWCVIAPPGGRWDRERPKGSYPLQTGDWMMHARTLRNADRALCCCSALHVLAVAVGTPVVCMEPAEARWNSIFWPVGTVGPQVTVVRGNDGRPTWDARHVRETLEGVLRG